MPVTMKEANEEQVISLPLKVIEMPAGFDTSLEGVFSDMQRRVRDQFLHNDGVATTFCLLSERSDGSCLITQVLCAWGDNMEKATVLHAVKAMINAKDDDSGDYLVKSFTFTAEAWVSESGDRTARPSKDPNRVETLIITARERGRPNSLCAVAKIKRHALSSKPGLDSWDVMDNAEMMFDMFDDDTTAKTVH